MMMGRTPTRIVIPTLSYAIFNPEDQVGFYTIPIFLMIFRGSAPTAIENERLDI